MKFFIYLFIAFTLLNSCKNNYGPEKNRGRENPTSNQQAQTVDGSWKLVYADIRENDSIDVKDLSKTDFIKIINKTHFAFFNQERGTAENFMSGAGTYTFNGTDYVETLDFISFTDYRGHEFTFKVEIKGDSLIQQGHEKIESANLDRYILEKYIRINQNNN